MGLPFLLVGLGVDRAARGLRRLQRHMRTIKVISGILLISVGLLVLVDALPQAAFMLGEMVGQPLGFSWPIWLPSLSYIASVSLQNGLYIDPGEGSLASPTALIAFFAGVLSFLSPCVLPLVPAYVSYLSGRAVGAAG
jgi:cytochrome c-type biogenesis protein